MSNEKSVETKPWYASRAVWGGIIAAVCGVLSLAGYTISQDLQQFLADKAVEIAVSVSTVIGGVLAVYGRLKAEKPIRKKE